MATGTTAEGRKAQAASTRDAVHAATGPARKPRAGPRPKPVAATLILFVRHGTTPTTGQVLPGRAPGLHLADRGLAEAEATAQRIASLTTPPAPTVPTTNGSKATAKKNQPSALTVAAVYASPLERAQETAAPIGTRLGLEVTIEPGLVEMDFGEWTGAELKALRKLPEWETIQRYPSGFTFPGGEAFSAMRARMAATIANLCLRHPGETIVAVSHADTIKAAVSDALGTHLDLFQRIVVSPCSVTAISYSPTGPIVVAVNTTGGLGGLMSST